MRIGLLTREYPPEVYGGAGVHVGFLVPRLRELAQVDVHCFGGQREDAIAHNPAPGMESANPALSTLSVDLAMTAALANVDLVHSHTWYANLAGHLSKVLHGVPHVVTAHSLEPRRPWKAEQLGGGYRLSSWVERVSYESADAVIAVSEGMRTDVLDCYPALDPARVHVVRNGIDSQAYHPVDETDVLERLGIDPTRPTVAFVGRITRQKGVGHLIAAAHRIDPAAQIVLCAGAPDTPEIAAETEAAVAELSAARPGVFWIQQMLPQPEIRQVLSHATAFVCPSVYEPLGIVNLEAMACGTAVVASDVGGIPEVVAEGETGLLVHYDERDVAAYRDGLARAINELLADPARARAMGAAGRERAVAEFSWAGVAEQTLRIYQSVT
ncbi:glycogen synthase [Kutzneria albida]|uniref:Glycogen synthase n=1 Tax=Kutzneria albida DSM 43870 TaxID=1449976 RepID=W5VZI2_9PSEU|nr:glycogen synthase [Kutzneria albida]AHH94328.1 glycogen synthase [Kutzneria albida DSM 43870]